jgi:hypothetical protein
MLEMLYAVPNGGHRNKLTALKLKNEGVVSGVWDLSLDYPSNGFHGLKIEVKAAKGRLTENQKKWREKYEKYSYKTAVVYSVEDFEKVLKEYIA